MAHERNAGPYQLFMLALCVFVLIVGATYLFTHIFSGRGALIHVGAFIGTIMAANVFMVIIPNQRVMTTQLLRGEAPAGHDALAAPPGLTGPAAPWGRAGSGIPEVALGGSAASLAPKE